MYKKDTAPFLKTFNSFFGHFVICNCYKIKYVKIDYLELTNFFNNIQNEKKKQKDKIQCSLVATVLGSNNLNMNS